MNNYDITINTNLLPSYIINGVTYYSSLKYYNPIKYNSVSRYSNVKTLYDDKTGIRYHVTTDRKDIATKSHDIYFKVDSKCENRLDIVSIKFYNYPTFWWSIAMANNIDDAFNVPIGTILRIPPMTTLYDKGSILY